MQSFNHSELRKLGVTMEKFTAPFLAIACAVRNQSHGATPAGLFLFVFSASFFTLRVRRLILSLEILI